VSGGGAGGGEGGGAAEQLAAGEFHVSGSLGGRLVAGRSLIVYMFSGSLYE